MVVVKKNIRPRLTSLQKAERRRRLLDMTRALADEGTVMRAGVRSFSEAHGRTESWTKRQLLIYHQARRAPNAWNAYTSKQVKEYNKDLPAGQRLTVSRFVAANREKLTLDYRALTDLQKTDLRQEIQAARDKHVKTARANPKAYTKYVVKIFRDMSNQWSTLCNQTQLNSCYIAVRDNLEDDVQPQIFYTKKFGEFIRDVIGMEPELFALRAEAYITTGLKAFKKGTKPGSAKECIASIRKQMQDNLDHILLSTRRADNAVLMQYTCYEQRILAPYGIKLLGWPLEKIVNPGKLSQAGVALVFEALEKKTCRFIALDPAEWEKEKDRVRSEWANLKKGAKSANGARSASVIGDTDDEAD